MWAGFRDATSPDPPSKWAAHNRGRPVRSRCRRKRKRICFSHLIPWRVRASGSSSSEKPAVTPAPVRCIQQKRTPITIMKANSRILFSLPAPWSVPLEWFRVQPSQGLSANGDTRRCAQTHNRSENSKPMAMAFETRMACPRLFIKMNGIAVGNVVRKTQKKNRASAPSHSWVLVDPGGRDGGIG